MEIFVVEVSPWKRGGARRTARTPVSQSRATAMVRGPDVLLLTLEPHDAVAYTKDPSNVQRTKLEALNNRQAV